MKTPSPRIGLGHQKRHDIGVYWLLTIMQVIHWFNPHLWLAFYQMRVGQESACDASVLSRMRHNQSADYANAIIGFLEKFCQNRQLPALAGVMESKSQMKRRIVMATNYKRFSRIMTLAAFALLISVGLSSFALSGFAEVKQPQTEKDVDNSKVYQLSQVQTEKGVDTGGVYKLEELDTMPAVIQPYPPAYPFEAKRQNIEGRVVVQFIVTKEGTARDVTISESYPAGVFDQSAIEAVEQYTFNPGTKSGEAVESIVRIPIVYTLD